MLCMESYGYILPMTHAAFSEGPGRPGGKNGVFFVIRSVSAGGRAFSQEAAGVTPWGVPQPIRKNE